MRVFRFLSVLFVLTTACSSVVQRTDWAPRQPLKAGGVRFLFHSQADTVFRSRLLIGFLQGVPGHFPVTVSDAAYRIRVTLGEWETDYTPIFFLIPPLLSYLGCPQGTVTRRWALAVYGGEENRLLVLREGLVRRPFGLYYMIPSVKGRISEALLATITAELAVLFK